MFRCRYLTFYFPRTGVLAYTFLRVWINKFTRSQDVPETDISNDIAHIRE